MAQHWIVASTYTKLTLTDAGVPAERIAVIPYGIDLNRFSPKREERIAARCGCSSSARWASAKESSTWCRLSRCCRPAVSSLPCAGVRLTIWRFSGRAGRTSACILR